MLPTSWYDYNHTASSAPEQDNAEDLCLIEALDSGKPLSQIRSIDVPETIAHFRYFAGWADKIMGTCEGKGSAGAMGAHS